MKFGKEWQEAFSKLPFALQKVSIPYKKWKKLIKSGNARMENLVNEIKSINAFMKSYKRTLMSLCIFPKPLSKNDLLLFLKLNKKCSYKICKKIQKKHMLDCQDRVHFDDFVPPSVIATLEMEVNPQHHDSCPICLDEIPSSFVMMHCGHIICTQCFRQINHIETQRGTLSNILAYNGKMWVECPMCRQKSHHTDISVHQIPVSKHT